MSFSREVNEACREPKAPTKQEQPPATENMERNYCEPSCNPFQGSDFERFMGDTNLTGFGSSSSSSSSVDPFLSEDDGFLSKEEGFLSKYDGLLSHEAFGDDSDVFNSREAFSDLLKEGWDMDMKFTPSSSEPSVKMIPSYTEKTFPAETATTTAPMTAENDESHVGGISSAAFNSREWLPEGCLGSHTDVPYDTVFKDDNRYSSVVDVTSPGYDWKADFFSQLQLLPPPPSPPQIHEEVQTVAEEGEEEEEEEAADVEIPDATAGEENSAPSPVPQDNATKTLAKKSPKKKRKRKPREKVLPDVYVYVEPISEDVLLGRGGKSNHHPGNKRYREEVSNLKKWYQGIQDDKEKTDLSQCLVDYVHSYGGRFLEKNQTGWFIVPNIVARRKASQALREDTDPVKRAAKRARYLEKKKRTDEEEEPKKKHKKNRG